MAYICAESAIYYTMTLGERIKNRRSLLGLTQQDLADYSGVSVRRIKSIESGDGNPSLKTLAKIAGTLGMEISLQVKGVDR